MANETNSNDQSNQLTTEMTTAKWQQSLLPLMKRMVIGLTLFFFIATFGQLIYLHLSIGERSELDIADAFKLLDGMPDYNFDQKMEAAKMEAMVLLEAESLQRRHHQANVLLMSRVWARYLGFVTGMILAFIGGIFILGKLETPVSDIGAKVGASEFSFKSASPGLILAALGVILMITTITIHHEIQVSDVKVYTSGDMFSTAGTDENVKPIISEDPPLLNNEK